MDNIVSVGKLCSSFIFLFYPIAPGSLEYSTTLTLDQVIATSQGSY